MPSDYVTLCDLGHFLLRNPLGVFPLGLAGAFLYLSTIRKCLKVPFSAHKALRMASLALSSIGHMVLESSSSLLTRSSSVISDLDLSVSFLVLKQTRLVRTYNT